MFARRSDAGIEEGGVEDAGHPVGAGCHENRGISIQRFRGAQDERRTIHRYEFLYPGDILGGKVFRAHKLDEPADTAIVNHCVCLDLVAVGQLYPRRDSAIQKDAGYLRLGEYLATVRSDHSLQSLDEGTHSTHGDREVQAGPRTIPGDDDVFAGREAIDVHPRGGGRDGVHGSYEVVVVHVLFDVVPRAGLLKVQPSAPDQGSDVRSPILSREHGLQRGEVPAVLEADGELLMVALVSQTYVVNFYAKLLKELADVAFGPQRGPGPGGDGIALVVYLRVASADERQLLQDAYAATFFGKGCGGHQPTDARADYYRVVGGLAVVTGFFDKEVARDSIIGADGRTQATERASFLIDRGPAVGGDGSNGATEQTVCAASAFVLVYLHLLLSVGCD